MSTGLTYDQVGDQFDLPRLNAMDRYWQSNPPVHISVARYLGIKVVSQDSEASQESEILALMQSLNQG